MEVAKLQGRLDLDDSAFSRGINRAITGFKKIHDQSVKLNQTFELVKNTFSIFTSAIQKSWQLMERGAKRVDLEATFQRLAKSQGRTADDMLSQIDKATKGTLTELESMALSTQSLMAGMKFDDAVTALQYLQRYAKATNKSFSQLTTTIMTGLARGSVLMLDDAGIILDQTSLVAQEQQRLGRSLSEVEKKAVLVNAAITQMKQKMGALGGSTRTAYDTMQGLQAQWQNFLDATGKYSLFAFGVVTLGWKAIFTELCYWPTVLRLNVEKNFSGILTTIRANLMEVMMFVRDYLNHTAAALSQFDNAIAQTAAKASSGMADMFNKGAISLFDQNMDSLTGVTRKRLEELVEEFQQKRIALKREIDALNALIAGKAPVDIPAGGFDLSPGTGNAPAADKNKDSQTKAFTEKLKRATLSDLEYKKWAINQEIADFKAGIAKKYTTEEEYLEFRKAKLKEITELELEATGSITDGWKKGWAEVSKEMEQNFTFGKGLAQDAASNMQGNFKTFFSDGMKGQLDDLGSYFENFFGSVLDAFIDMQAEMLARSIMKGTNTFFEGLFGNFLPNAKGNAFVNGKVQAFASGGIVNRPTMFTHSSGLGIMGEAGAEAIMPLTRASNGDLGVKVQGNAAPPVSVNVINNGSDVDAKVGDASWDGEQWVVNVILDAYQRNRGGLKEVMRGTR